MLDPSYIISVYKQVLGHPYALQTMKLYAYRDGGTLVWYVIELMIAW